MTSVVELAAHDTHDLRRRVLRADETSPALDWPGDDDETTLHLGVVVAGRIVAVSTWLARPSAEWPELTGRQLRGMATDIDVRGTGIGALLLDAGVERAITDGVALLWANARTDAIGFYERHGWKVSGPTFATPETGIPHRVVTRELLLTT